MTDRTGSQPVLHAVTYWSRDLGPYIWHEYDAERVRADLRAMSDAGVRAVRTLLPWDVFLPSPARVEPACLRNFEACLGAAEAASLLLIPVLFAQSVGDCVMLPSYAIDVGARRRGVRAVTGGVVQPGGPRDQYTDARMLEAEMVWLETMLDAFAGNPVLAEWDLGHDPATTVRPRRIDDLRRWAEALAARVHERGERCTLTLGAGDVTTARAVRLDAAAPAVDLLGVAVDPVDLGFAAGMRDARPLAFLAQLALGLAGRAAPPLHVEVGVAHGDGGDDAALARDTVSALLEVGCAGLRAAAWSDCGERVAALPPFDRRPSLLWRGLVGVDGQPTAFGRGWLESMRDEHGRRPPAPWPETIDGVDYYASLPHSIDDMYAAWQRVASDHPGMLG